MRCKFGSALRAVSALSVIACGSSADGAPVKLLASPTLPAPGLSEALLHGGVSIDGTHAGGWTQR